MSIRWKKNPDRGVAQTEPSRNGTWGLGKGGWEGSTEGAIANGGRKGDLGYPVSEWRWKAQKDTAQPLVPWARAQRTTEAGRLRKRITSREVS